MAVADSRSTPIAIGIASGPRHEAALVEETLLRRFVRGRLVRLIGEVVRQQTTGRPPSTSRHRHDLTQPRHDKSSRPGWSRAPTLRTALDDRAGVRVAHTFTSPREPIRAQGSELPRLPEDVDDHVQAEVPARCRAVDFRNVPRPELVRGGGKEFGHTSLPMHHRRAPLTNLVVRREHAVHRALRATAVRDGFRTRLLDSRSPVRCRSTASHAMSTRPCF